jgi:hypothetical protein
VPDEPADRALPDVVLPPVAAPFEPPPPPEVDPVAAVVVGPTVAVVAVVVGNVTAPYGLARVIPPTPLVVPVVCAAAGRTSPTKGGNAKINDLRMRLTIPPPVSRQCCGAEQRSATSAFETA